MNQNTLVIGFALPNFKIDNYNVFSAPSYFDYEAIIVDPASITRDAGNLVTGEMSPEAFDGRAIVNGATSGTAVSAAEQIRRRGPETVRLLETGGIVVVFGRPNTVVTGLLGFEGCDRYAWLPAPAGMSWGAPYLRAAEGKQVRVVDEDHPMNAFLRKFRNDVAYRAVFDERQPAFREHARVIAVGGGNAPIAVEFRVLGGRVIFLPAISESVSHQRGEMAEMLVDLMGDLKGEELDTERPYWLASAALPGISEREQALNAARAAHDSSKSDLTSAEEQYDEVARHRRILFEGGPALMDAVVEGLRVLGFEVEQTELGVTVTHEGKTALLEVEGSRERVVEWPYVRLQRRLEERILKREERLDGLIVVNGFRLTAPDAREQEYTDALRIACENYRYGLLTGRTLFDLVKLALDEASDADLLGIRRRIMKVNGLLDTPTALGEREPVEPEPLF